VNCAEPSRGLRRLRSIAAVAVAALALGAEARAQSIPGLVELPAAIADSHSDLVGRRTALEQERSRLHGQVEALNGRCASVVVGSGAEAACTRDRATLLTALGAHIQASSAFNAAASAAIAAIPPPLPLDADSLRVVNGIEALATKRGWSAEKLARLDLNLRALEMAGPIPEPEEVRAIWRDILAYGQDPDLARDASRGGGLGLPGAGNQGHHTDCAVFALANATGLPYGVVATSAADLIRQADWRTPQQTANPRATIESGGLNGGEVIMLAEFFGRSEVVPSSQFANLLAQRRPVMVNVAVPKGADEGEHEIVLAKAFQHAGETWYVIIDSNRGPTQRLFARASEVNTLLLENGVVYRPDPGRTARLLRDSSAP
jgi:hypothetical protein